MLTKQLSFTRLRNKYKRQQQRQFRKRNEAQSKYVEQIVSNIEENRISLQHYQGKGVGLVAKRDFEMGEIVFNERPYFVSPVQEQEGHSCSYCLKTPLSFRDILKGTELLERNGIELLIENIDKSVLYKPLMKDERTGKHFCDEKCRDLSWNDYDQVIYHDQYVSPFVDNESSKSMKYFIYTLQAKLISSFRNGESVESVFEPVMNLMAFPFENLPRYPHLPVVEQLTESVRKLLKPGEYEDFLTYQFQFLLYCKVNLNFLEIHVTSPLLEYLENLLVSGNEQEKQIAEEWASTGMNRNILSTQGYGIYPVSALLNHHCAPNLSYSLNQSSEIRWAASKEISKGDELTIAYVDPSIPYEERQQYLTSRHFFGCKCDTDCAVKN